MNNSIRVSKSRQEIADIIRRAHYKACWGSDIKTPWHRIDSSFRSGIWLSCADAIIAAIEDETGLSEGVDGRGDEQV